MALRRRRSPTPSGLDGTGADLADPRARCESILIVNADDFGANPRTSDPVVELFDERVLTSASAMVRMRDSVRAASLAAEHGIPVGLHLNLTLPFADPSAPPAVRERQLRLTEVFGSESWRDAGRERPGGRLLADVIEDQLECFRESFGEPTHLDGHHHVHTHRAVLEQLPTDLPIRPILSVPSHAGAGRSMRERRLHRRFLCPEACFALEDVHPSLGGVGLQALDHAHRQSLEIMVHPRQEREYAALLSADWRQAISTLTLGSYADLARVRGR
ncbi:MAG: ChbG/HpnK family deacetylase [Solirubrobacteraceae bacterium]